MIRAALCDSDREERKRICAMLGGYPLSVKITEYDAIEALLWDMETEGARYDLYFLPLGGEDTAERVWAMDGGAALIFLSEDTDADGKGLDVRGMGCLEKPVREKALRALMEELAERLRRDQRRVLVITQRNRTHILRFEEIEYISSANHILRFYLRGGEEYTCYGRLDQMASQLDPEIFVRCHQSHMVNLNWVVGHTPKAFHMSGGAAIPISRRNALQSRRALEEYLFYSPPAPEDGA